MTHDPGLFDAYSSMYSKKEEPQQQDEAIVTGSILAAKAAMGALKGAKVAGALGKAANVAGKVSAVADAAGSVADATQKIRGKGQKHPDNQQEAVEVEVNEGDTYAKQLARFEAGRQKRMKASGSYERPNYIPKDQDHSDKYGSSKGKKTTKEEVEGGVSVVDYNSDYQPTEIETVDLMPLPKMKGTEDLHEDDAELESRLWDQVAANLTTLGEMAGIKYQVSPLEEKKEDDDKKDDDKKDKKKKDTTKNKDEKWQDSDGDGKWYEKGEDVKEGFNVKSPVVFSKKEEEVVDPSMLEEKCASSIKKAHKAIKK